MIANALLPANALRLLSSAPDSTPPIHSMNASLPRYPELRPVTIKAFASASQSSDTVSTDACAASPGAACGAAAFVKSMDAKTAAFWEVTGLSAAATVSCATKSRVLGGAQIVSLQA